MTLSTAERLRSLTQKTIYGNAVTGAVQADPPDLGSEDADAWLPFVICRIDPDSVKSDGWVLAFAAHELERFAEAKLTDATDARAQFDSSRPADRKGKGSYTPPPIPAQELTDRYLAKRGEIIGVLNAGLIEPRYAEVREVLGPLEQGLYTAIINFGAVKPTGEKPSAS